MASVRVKRKISLPQSELFKNIAEVDWMVFILIYIMIMTALD